MSKRICLAESDDEILDCRAVMAELRPHIARDEFLPRVKRQAASSGFRMAYLSDEEEVKAVGGFRISEWLVDYAKRENCNQIKLVSHVRRFAAHKFYLNKGMIIEAHYFSLKL